MRKTLFYQESRADYRKPLAALCIVALCLAGPVAGWLLHRKQSATLYHSPDGDFCDYPDYYNSTHHDFAGVWVTLSLRKEQQDNGLVLFVNKNGTYESWKVRPTDSGAYLLSYARMGPGAWMHGPLKGINLYSSKYWVVTSTTGRWEAVPTIQQHTGEGRRYSLPKVRFSQSIDPDDPKSVPQDYKYTISVHQINGNTLTLQSPFGSYDFSEVRQWVPELLWVRALRGRLSFTQWLILTGADPAWAATQTPPHPIQTPHSSHKYGSGSLPQ